MNQHGGHRGIQLPTTSPADAWQQRTHRDEDERVAHQDARSNSHLLCKLGRAGDEARLLGPNTGEVEAKRANGHLPSKLQNPDQREAGRSLLRCRHCSLLASSTSLGRPHARRQQLRSRGRGNEACRGQEGGRAVEEGRTDLAQELAQAGGYGRAALACIGVKQVIHCRPCGCHQGVVAHVSYAEGEDGGGRCTARSARKLRGAEWRRREPPGG
mmetsp:Transcript_53296/g.155253  ORF Transcript_53296/g.155253 Transcript_53296/m.155253 type:complete len:214 (-) Transcript_53296:334-975(-)